MTDKQIIIDGIDVSRCKHYDDRYGYCEACKDDIDGTSFTKCMYEPNCHYKQLKRTEQKLAKIKEIVKYYAEIKCEDCKYLSVHCVDCNEIIEKEVIRIIEGKENG